MTREAEEAMQRVFPVPVDRRTVSGRAVLDQVPSQSHDLLQDREHAYCEAVKHVSLTRATLAVPMRYQGLVIGAIAVGRDTPGEFSAPLVRLLQAFANQAVIAMRNAQLFQTTREALERQTATAEVLRVISSSVIDTTPVFRKIVDSCDRLLTTDLAAVWLLDDDGQLHLAAIRTAVLDDAQTVPRTLPMANSVIGMPLRESRVVHLRVVGAQVFEHDGRRLADDAVGSNDRAWIAAIGDHTLLGVPLRIEGRFNGAIALVRRPPRPFSDEEIGLITTFADQAVIAIENTRLFNETREALEQQTATAEVLRAISSSVADAQPVFEKILESCLRLFNVKDVGIFLVDDRNLLDLAAGRGPVMPLVADVFPMSIEGTVQETAIRARHPIRYSSVTLHPPLPIDIQFVRNSLGDHSAIVAPMIWEGRGIGNIVIAAFPARTFSDKEIALLGTFAGQAVIAIQNARLFNETKAALEQQTATAEVLQVIGRSVEDAQPVFEKILDSCERLIASTDSSVMVVDENLMVHVGSSRGEQGRRFARLAPTPAGKTVIAHALQARRVMHYADVLHGEGVPEVLRKVAQKIGNFSVITAPMLWHGQGVGGLNVVRRHAARQWTSFTSKDMTLLATFADQAVIAIQNARLFREIEDKGRELAAANQHKSEFLANMSHELRTPLNAIIGFSEVLLERMFGDLNEKQADYLQDIFASGHHLLALINDILDLSKIEAGRMELELSTFGVAAAIGNAVSLVRERALQHGLALNIDVSPELGEWRADERKFKQVLLNLLSNAVKFTPDGGQVAVRAGCREDALLEVAVSDTGIGIAPEDQAAVFEEFRQVGRHYTNKNEGTGLGLALTRRLVELHGGALGVQSAPGQGSIFTFTIPRQP
jgi:signal transduction histidine kinase/putative methionine-R-sulfoxide reductase with GAF domain